MIRSSLTIFSVLRKLSSLSPNVFILQTPNQLHGPTVDFLELISPKTKNALPASPVPSTRGSACYTPNVVCDDVCIISGEKALLPQIPLGVCCDTQLIYYNPIEDWDVVGP